MTNAEWIMVAAIVVGPVFAVAITLWIEGRRKRGETKLFTLRMLLSTRDVPSDPGYQIAVKLIPLEFNDCPAVLVAHQEFLAAANIPPEGKSEDEIRGISANTSVRLTRLIYEMSQAVGLKLRETDIQTGGFGTRGFFYREMLAQDSQKAMRDIADILWMQTRLLRGDTPDQIFGPADSSTAISEAETNPKKKK